MDTYNKRKGKSEWVQERKEELAYLSRVADDGILNITGNPDAFRQFIMLLAKVLNTMWRAIRERYTK